MKKGVKFPKKRCEIADLEEFSLENYANHIFSCSNQVGGLYGTNEKLIRCKKGAKPLILGSLIIFI